ncbi:MAG: hypothetical protein AAGC88_07745 [Bacteroidota bacterium]
MKSLTIDILDPKAEAVLKKLEGQSFIRISNPEENSLDKVLKKIREQASDYPELTDDEILEEVKIVRRERQGKSSDQADN